MANTNTKEYPEFIRSACWPGSEHAVYESVPKPYQCMRCAHSFIMRAEMMSHVKLEHNRGRRHMCPVCGAGFFGRGVRNAHLRFEHRGRDHSSSPGSLECCVCGRGFCCRKDRTTHMRIHTLLYDCTECGLWFNREEQLVEHAETHKKKPYECYECDKPFRQSVRCAKSGKKERDVRKEIDACKCEKRFYRRDGNLTRRAKVKTGERPLKCVVCKKSFAYRQSLIAHLNIHTGEKPFECQVCEQKFHSGGSLTIHMIVHRGEKPLECKQCGKHFINRKSLDKHSETHEEKPYECTNCGKCFSKIDDVKTHIVATHISKPNKYLGCEQCDGNFCQVKCTNCAFNEARYLSDVHKILSNFNSKEV